MYYIVCRINENIITCEIEAELCTHISWEENVFAMISLCIKLIYMIFKAQKARLLLSKSKLMKIKTQTNKYSNSKWQKSQRNEIVLDETKNNAH